jgi:transcriptional regulator
MYNPASFAETRPEILEAAMAGHPLATLVTAGSGGLAASHIPLLYYRTATGLGVLRGHLARANPQWHDYSSDSQALAIFSGPQHYISPTWYPSTQEHGKVVPTWNYVVVHAHGPIAIRNEPEWLRENVRALSDVHESASATPWQVADAPPEFIANMLNAIVGVELTIARLEGKWKLSQNRPIPDRQGVVRGLQALDSPAALQMAELVKANLPK